MLLYYYFYYYKLLSYHWKIFKFCQLYVIIIICMHTVLSGEGLLLRFPFNFDSGYFLIISLEGGGHSLPRWHGHGAGLEVIFAIGLEEGCNIFYLFCFWDKE